MRLLYAIGSGIAVFLLAMSMYLEAAMNMVPCLLCLLQRGVLGLIAGLFGVAAMLPYRRARRSLALLTAMTTVLGSWLAGRQLWLQYFVSHSSQPGNCDASLWYLLKVFPLDEVIKHILWGEGATCAKPGPVILLLNPAQWALCSFLFFLVWSIYLFIKEGRRYTKDRF